MFEFPAELAARLRQVRLAAGLTQAQVAMLMGRQGRGAWNVVARLESGRVRYPSLGLVLDFLRACRADVSAIADILNDYCRRPVDGQEQAQQGVQAMVAVLPEPVRAAVLKYDRKTALLFRNEGRLRAPDYELPPGRRAWLQYELPERRLARVRRMANSRLIVHELEQELARVLAPYWASLSPADRLFLRRQAVGVLAMRLRPGSARRWQALERAAVRAGFAGREELELARNLAEEMYADLEAAGLVEELRSGPPIRIAGYGQRSAAALRRDQERKQAKAALEEYGRKRYMFQLALRQAGEAVRVESADEPVRDWVVRTLAWLLVDCDPESATMEQTLAELGRTTGRPELVQQVVAALVAKFEEIRDRRPVLPTSEGAAVAGETEATSQEAKAKSQGESERQESEVKGHETEGKRQGGEGRGVGS